MDRDIELYHIRSCFIEIAEGSLMGGERVLNRLIGAIDLRVIFQPVLLQKGAM